MLYEEQCKIEEINKQIISKILQTTAPDTFINYYLYHTQKETCNYFGIRTTKQLTKILKLFNYDFSKPKPSKFKGKPAVRTHESYVTGGQKSAQTQKKSWANKSEKEKQDWSQKQSQAHLNEATKQKIIANNKTYKASLTEEEKVKQNKMRSISMKNWWLSLSEEDKGKVLNNRFINGKTYSSKDSGPNLSFQEKLKQYNISFERELCLDKKFFDFKINNILVEIDPTFTHNSTFTPFKYNTPLDKNYHINKTNIANNYNYRCIHIFDWDDQDKIINMLLLDNKQIIYGRLCKIAEISKKDGDTFINKHHLQGTAKAKIYLGLFYNSELVSVMTFGKPRYNKKYEYELIRYCTNAKVIGGAEKLFKYFLKKYKPQNIISYCDLSKFVGNLYTKLGFKLIRKPQPSKHWYNIKTKEHYLDSLVRQHGFSRLINHCDAKNDNLSTNDNKTLLIEAGFVEVYDCGQAAFGFSYNQ